LHNFLRHHSGSIRIEEFGFSGKVFWLTEMLIAQKSRPLSISKQDLSVIGRNLLSLNTVSVTI